MIAHIWYNDLVNQSNEIYDGTFWYYFTSYEDITRMVNDLSLRKKSKREILVTIAAKIAWAKPTGSYKEITPTGWKYMNFGINF